MKTFTGKKRSRTVILLFITSSYEYTVEIYYKKCILHTIILFSHLYIFYFLFVCETDPVNAYLGIPYASPPVNAYRFMPPVAPLRKNYFFKIFDVELTLNNLIIFYFYFEAWGGTRLAVALPPACPQKFPDITNRTKVLQTMTAQRYQLIQKLIPHLANQSEDCLYLNVYQPVVSGNYT